MEVEFHYYITGIIAHRAGFTEEEASIIAYSSQFVDDNDIILNVKDRMTGEVSSNYISQTMDILKPKMELMRIYPVFHYVPGDPIAVSTRRKDGKMHILNTTPDNDIANNMLSSAFRSSPDVRLYRIGIATHAYVDTWAHQNFAGFKDSFNGNVFNPIPNIGHAEAKHHPDWVGHSWEDDRLVEGKVDNNLRFVSAAKRLFEKYVEYLGSDASWLELENELLIALGRCKRGHQCYGREGRLERYNQIAEWLPQYDEDIWFNEAIEQRVRLFEDPHEGILSKFTLFKDEYFWKEDVEKEDTHWFRFQVAVKEHQAFALDPINDKCETMGCDIRML